MCVSYVHLLCALPLLKGHASGGCNSSGYMLATVLVTFPVVMTKHPDTLEGLILTTQFKVTVHLDEEVTKAAGHVTLTVEKQRVMKASSYSLSPFILPRIQSREWCHPHQLIYLA